MSRRFLFLFVVWANSSAYAGSADLTVYNAGFAVVRETVPLVLQQGDNDVLAPPVSPFLDPASVMLRDPAGKSDFRILLQKFRADALTEQRILARFEGQTIPFRIHAEEKIGEVMGKIIRGGYWQRESGSVVRTSEPIIEIDGHYVFSLPGVPIFPKLPEGEILKPELRWKIGAAKATTVDAELVYKTDGLSWQADYNAIVADDGKISQLIGWITLENDTGVQFENSHLKLVAGNIRRVRGGLRRYGDRSEVERVIVTGSNIPTAEESSAGPSIQ